MEQSSPLIAPPLRLRIIAWFWLAFGIVAIVTDLGVLWLGGSTEFNVCWFLPILGVRLVRFGFLSTVVARALAWLGCVVTLLLTIVAIASPAVLAICPLFAFFVWQIRVLYSDDIRFLAVRGESNYKPRAVVSIDLLSLFFWMAVCAMSISSLIAIRVEDATGSFYSSVSSVDGMTVIVVEPDQIGLFGQRKHGGVTMLTGIRGNTSGAKSVTSFVSLDDKEFVLDSDDVGITVFDGRKLETSLKRVPGDSFKEWVDSKPVEISVQSLLEFAETSAAGTDASSNR